MEEPTPSGREMEILKVLWELGQGSVRDIYRRLCPHEELAFNTVQTLVRIMDDKGLVSHEKQGRTFIYTPRYSRQRAASRFLHQVFDGALDQVVLSMISTTDPDPEELRQLEKIIAEARRRKQRECAAEGKDPRGRVSPRRAGLGPGETEPRERSHLIAKEET